VDPDNHYVWKANVRRLDAEVVRDSLLYVAGKLDMTQGGPEIDYRQGEVIPRRSLYFRQAYEKQMTMLVTFDAPSPNECYRRSPSIIPQQALALSNSPLAISLARQLAGALSEQCGAKANADEPGNEFIEQAFLTILSREPTPKERDRCVEFLSDQATRLTNPDALSSIGGVVTASVPSSSDSGQRARENLVHVLMNHNDFVTAR
jgi:hypothetical protein